MMFDSQGSMSTEELRGYGAVAMDHLRAPRNLGFMSGADAVGRATAYHCCGRIEVQLKVDRRRRRIEQARFVSSGCPSTVAALSLITGLIRGESIDRALRLSEHEVLLRLGAVPPESEECVAAAAAATREAALRYLDRICEEETLPGHGAARLDPALRAFVLAMPAA